MADRPNIVFLLPDQMRADFLGCYGAGFIETPNIDSLCAEGVRYKRAIVPSTICVPVRASLMTGLNPVEHGVLDNTYWLRDDHERCGIRTWPKLLGEAGYHTEGIGKMHFCPWDANEGFEHRVVVEDKRHIFIKDDYADYLAGAGLRKFHGAEHEGYFENKGAVVSKIPSEHQVDRWVANESCKFIEEYEGEGPFALMVGFPGPHCPYDPPAELAEKFRPEDMPEAIAETAESRSFKEWFVNLYKKEWCQIDYSEFTAEQARKVRAYYAALIYQIDGCVGQIVESLKAKGVYDNTVIIFASDHGDFLGDYGVVGKHFFYEPNVRVPLIVRVPNGEGGKVYERTVCLTDVRSTILSVAGVEDNLAEKAGALPGLGLEGQREREYVFSAFYLGFMVTDDTWKLCRYENGARMLFNIKEDPQEQNNLIDEAGCGGELGRLEEILQKEVISSIRVANVDKSVHKRRVDCEGRGYGERGWKWPYPLSE